MKINVYLPDEIGIKAKNENINFSRLLRSVVEPLLAEKEMFKGWRSLFMRGPAK